MFASKKKSIPDWHLFITQMEMKWTKWYAMTSHAIAYRSLELLLGTHTFDFNCFLEDFNCVFTQIRCLYRVLWWSSHEGFLSLCSTHKQYCEVFILVLHLCITCTIPVSRDSVYTSDFVRPVFKISLHDLRVPTSS